jgi:primase-polymerase (primpol)-like protein
LNAETVERPQALQVRQSSIPDGLKVRPQWVNWRYARQVERWTKHPYNPRSGKKASSTDLLTWREIVGVAGYCTALQIPLR